MFTRKELQVLREALVGYQGPYGADYQKKGLTTEEKEYHEKSMKTAESLLERIEELITE